MNTGNPAPGAVLHELLLRLAAIAPDALVIEARRELARSGVSAAAKVVTSVAADLPLTRYDLEVLDSVGAPAAVRPEWPDPPLRWHFAPGGAAAGDLELAMAVAMAGAESGARGLWLAERSLLGGGASHPVYVLEVDDDDPAAVTGRLQDALTGAGAAMPLAEVVVAGAAIPGYQRAALESGVLLWAPEPEVLARVARTYDHVDRLGVAGFRHGHPVIEGQEKDAVLAYLRTAPVLLESSAAIGDVVEPERGRVVSVRMRTDGEWVWPDAVGYYLDRYGLAPEPALLAHIEAVGVPPAELDAVTIHRVLAQLRAFRPRQPIRVESQGAEYV
ncbi:hypothetical protein AB5J62_24510 [Amycolatopsis sp. cg5]|uniref:hypothetical protein n=1 Tax=Amycolatopsis sp. cg5 TaxID=3238802 RepID=UPI00352334DD